MIGAEPGPVTPGTVRKKAFHLVTTKLVVDTEVTKRRAQQSSAQPSHPIYIFSLGDVLCFSGSSRMC